jgi:hypothetical protein
MSGIIQKKTTPSGIASPATGSVFMGIDDSGVFYTKNESGTVTTYPTTSGGGSFTGGTVSFLSATTLSSTTLNVDFTETLDFVTTDDYESLYGFEYLNALSTYVDLNITGDFIGTSYEGGVDSISVGTVDGQAELVGTGLSFPVVGVGSVIEVGSGNYSGSFIRHAGTITDQTGLGGNLGRAISLRGSFVDGISGDKTIMGYELGIGTNPYYNVAQKINNAGERVDLKLDENITGFVIDNDLSDNSATLFNIRDNNTDSVFEVRNDGVFATDLSATTLSSTTLNVDFTETLQFFSDDDFSAPFGFTYFGPPLDWVDLTISGDFMGSILTETNHTLYDFIGDGQGNAPSLGLSFPADVAGNILAVTGGSMSGSNLIDVLTYIDQSGLGGSEQYSNQNIMVYIDPISGDKTQISFSQGFDSDGAGMFFDKQNNAGENVTLVLNDDNEGLTLFSGLSDLDGSIFKIQNSNSDVVFEVTGNGIDLAFSELQINSNTTGSTDIFRVNNINNEGIFRVNSEALFSVTSFFISAPSGFTSVDNILNVYNSDNEILFFVNNDFGATCRLPVTGSSNPVLQVQDYDYNTSFAVSPSSPINQVECVGNEQSASIFRIVTSGYTNNLLTVNQSGSTIINSIAPTGTSQTIFSVSRNNFTSNPISITSENSTSILDDILYFSNTLPTSPSGLSSGQIYTQTSAELGGSGSTKVLCIA